MAVKVKGHSDPFEAVDKGMFDKLPEYLGKNDPVWKVEPMTFEQFIVSPEHMDHPPLSERQMRDAMAFLGSKPKEVFNNGSAYSTAVFLWGKGSGKDLLASIIQCYAVYILLCMKDPQGFFDSPRTEPLDIINVAYSSEQASRVYFVKFSEKVRRWKWLKENYAIEDGGRLMNRENSHLPRVKIGGNNVEFPSLIRAVSEHSQNESYEGYNILLWVMDEASAFKSNTKERNADKVYSTLKSSATSRFGARWKGLILSFPRGEEDFTVTMYQQSLKDKSIYGSLGYTWDIKPSYFFSGERFEFEGEQVPVEFQNDFTYEPEDSKCKYMCKPPKEKGAFFTYPERITECINMGREPLFDVESIIVEHELEDASGLITNRKQFIGKTISTWRSTGLQDLGRPRVIHVDAGLTKDSAGMVVAHGIPVELRVQNAATGQFESLTVNKVVVDAVIEWRPDPTRKLQVSLNNVEAMIIDLSNRGLKLSKVTYDQWNSQSSLEMFMSKRINAEQHTINAEDYRNLRMMVYSGGIDLLPYPQELLADPYWLLVHELQHLIQINQKIDHPVEGTKDLADCLAGVNRLLNNFDQKREVFNKLPKTLRTQHLSPNSRPLSPQTEGLPQMPSGPGMPQQRPLVGTQWAQNVPMNTEPNKPGPQPVRQLPRTIRVGPSRGGMGPGWK